MLLRRGGPPEGRQGSPKIAPERRALLPQLAAWPPGWSGFDQCWGADENDETESIAAALDEELRREVASGHELFGRRCWAIGKRRRTDDVLFAVGPRKVAVVHLTWTMTPEDAPWPWTTVYGSFEDFLEAIPADFPED